MGYTLPQKVRSLTPYEPLSGSYSVRLDANESCFALPPPLKAQIFARLQEIPLNRYPDALAADLCEKAAARWGVRPEQILAGNGSDELIFLLQSCLMQKGAVLGVFPFDFSMYGFYASLCELECVTLPKREDLSTDIDAAIAAINTRDVDMVLFSNPCNPTSLLLEKDQIERLVKSVRSLVVVDEAYMEFADASVIDLINQYDNLCVLKTCSKAVGLAGIRVGFALANPALIAALRGAKSPYNVNALSQEIAAAVLDAPGYVDACAAKLRCWTQTLCEELETLAAQHAGDILCVYPSRTNFVWMKMARAPHIRQRLAVRGVAVRQIGEHLRVSCGTPQENAIFLQALRDTLAE